MFVPVVAAWTGAGAVCAASQSSRTAARWSASVPVGWTYQGAASLELLTILHCAASKSDTGAIRVSDGTYTTVVYNSEGVIKQVA